MVEKQIRNIVLGILLSLFIIAVFPGCTERNTEPSSNSSTPTPPAGGNQSETGASATSGQMTLIPGGVFEMGDHYGYVDPKHPGDELPIHTVSISQFYIGKNDTTVQQYCEFLNSSMSQGLLSVAGGSYPVTGGPRDSISAADGLVYFAGGKDILFVTRQAYQYGTIGWDGSNFSVLDNRNNHPATGITWYGAAAYCNWLSLKDGYQPCYNTTTWDCDFTRNGYRLPTEAEWEYAARGGQYNPYYNYPWGNDADTTKANWPNSGDPYETGSFPHTTPAGFYNGQLQKKSDFGWPGSQETYQTSNGTNSYGLYDMAGNVWQWCNDWYRQDYYKVSPTADPTGPAMSEATPMQDGKIYRCMRGGNWYNGEPDINTPSIDNGHSRVSNRDPAYYLGQEEFQYSEVGFRVARRDSQSIPGRTVGLFLNDPRAWVGYTLLAPKQYTTTYLIDNQGQVVHEWTASKYPPGQSAYLLENGDLIRAASVRNPDINTGGGEGGRIEEYDWNDNLVWQLDYSSTQYMQHHDFVPLPNGNILMLVCEKKTYAEAVASGFDPGELKQVQNQGYMLPDSVVEIKPTKPVGGTVVWEWHVWDHLVQDYSAAKSNYGNVAAHPELIDPNGGRQIAVFWNHMNSITYNCDLDQVMLSVRGNSEIWIIDHSTTTAQATGHTGGKYGKGGDLLYRWGNPSQYRAGTQNDQTLFQQHCAIWIPLNYPGAGDILIFNNGIGRNYTTVDEITPPTDANGNYTLADGSAYGPKNLTWTYKANPPASFYASEISGAQRLPNGNTLICDGIHGILFEVTPGGETVWKYINPVVRTGPLGATDTIPPDTNHQGQFMNEVFTVLRYAPNYPGLQGKNLTPGGTIEK